MRRDTSATNNGTDLGVGELNVFYGGRCATMLLPEVSLDYN